MLHEIYSVTAFEVIAPYTLCIKFNDNSVRSIDFRPMLRGELFGPLLRLDFLIKSALIAKPARWYGLMGPTSIPRRFMIGIKWAKP